MYSRFVQLTAARAAPTQPSTASCGRALGRTTSTIERPTANAIAAAPASPPIERSLERGCLYPAATGWRCSGPSDPSVSVGRRPLRKLFSKEQRGFFAAHAPDGVELDELAVLGPIFVLKLKFAPAGFPRKLVAEMWLYPDESRILELSTKCLPPEAFQTAAETRAFLAGRGIDLSGEQQTKTRRALEFFSARLEQ